MVPPLEPGLVKKEVHPLNGGGQNVQNWEDVGAAWDELVNEGDDGDELSWASDAEGGELVLPPGARVPNEYFSVQAAVVPLNEYAFPATNGQASAPAGEGSGPADSSAPQQQPQNGDRKEPAVQFNDVPRAGEEVPIEQPNGASAGPDSGAGAGASAPPLTCTSVNVPAAVQTQPIDVPQVAVADSHSVSAGSASSSSEGSPVGRLDAAMADAALNRGRPRAQTPIQGSFPSGVPEWFVPFENFVLLMCLVSNHVLLRRPLQGEASDPRRVCYFQLHGGTQCPEATCEPITSYGSAAQEEQETGVGSHHP